MKKWLRTLIFLAVSVPLSWFFAQSPARDIFPQDGFIHKWFALITWVFLYALYRIEIIFLWFRGLQKAAAAQVVGEIRTLDETETRYEEALMSDYDMLDREFYHDNTLAFSKEGYSLLGDFRDAGGLEKFPDSKAVFRVMLNDETDTFAMLLHFLKLERDPDDPNAEPEIAAEVHTISLLSRRPSGDFVVTAMTEAPPSPNFAPCIQTTSLPFASDPPGLIAEHEKALSSKPGGTAPVSGMRDYLDMIDDMQRAAREYRAERGIKWYKEYFALMGQKKAGAKLLPHIKAELKKRRG